MNWVVIYSKKERRPIDMYDTRGGCPLPEPPCGGCNACLIAQYEHAGYPCVLVDTEQEALACFAIDLLYHGKQ